MHGLNQWDRIAALLPERTPRQCRDRYEYYLAPNVYNPPWTAVQDEMLLEKLAEWGPRWVFLARFFPGRNGNHLKNRWYKVLAKKMRPEQSGTSVIQDYCPQTTFEDQSDSAEFENGLIWDEFTIE
jgi:hypothetical protein